MSDGCCSFGPVVDGLNVGGVDVLGVRYFCCTLGTCDGVDETDVLYDGYGATFFCAISDGFGGEGLVFGCGVTFLTVGAIL